MRAGTAALCARSESPTPRARRGSPTPRLRLTEGLPFRRSAHRMPPAEISGESLRRTALPPAKKAEKAPAAHFFGKPCFTHPTPIWHTQQTCRGNRRGSPLPHPTAV